MKKLTIIFIMFILMISFVVGEGIDQDTNTQVFEYLGDYSSYFQNGLFNPSMLDDTPIIRSVTPISKFLVSDLDNDGNNDIVLIDSSPRVIIYDKLLNEIGSQSITCDTYEDMTLYDFDSDNLKEIVIMCESYYYVIGYDGENVTTYQSGSIISTGFNNYDNGDYGNFGGVRCNDNKCFMVRLDKTSTTMGSVAYLISVMINKTSEIVETQNNLDTALSYSKVNAQSNIVELQFYDMGNDGIDNVIYGGGFSAKSGTTPYNGYVIYSLAYNDTDFYLEDVYKKQVSSNTQTIHGSAPFVSNLASNSGAELVYGFSRNNQFKMYMYSLSSGSLLSYIDEFPELQTGNGTYLSNIIRADIYDTTSNNEFCVLGVNPTDKGYDFMCGNKLDNLGLNPETEEYTISLDNDITISSIIHLQPTEQYQENGHNEIVTPTGIYIVNNPDNFLYDSYITQEDSLNYLTIAQDVDNDDLTEILYLSSDSMYIIQDGYIDKYGYINPDQTLFNPCINTLIKVNSTAQLSVQVSDYENGGVCARAYLYYDDTNQQNSTELCGSSDDVFNFYYTYNKTGTNYILRIEGNDLENPDNIHSEEYLFSVGNNGVEYGDCSTRPLITIPDGTGYSENDTSTSTGGVLGTNTTATGDNIIETQIQSVSRSSGLGTLIIWLILMMIVAVYILYLGSNNQLDTKIIAGVIALSQIIMLIIGVKLEYISVGILWTIVAIGIIAGALIGSKIITGRSGV